MYDDLDPVLFAIDSSATVFMRQFLCYLSNKSNDIVDIVLFKMSANKGKSKAVENTSPTDTKETNQQSSFSAKEQKDIQENALCWIGFITVSVLSVLTRLYKIHEPSHIVWDETHFGKFGSWYINRKFFFDVHPPLGKMMIGLFGFLSGYQGNFSFEKPGIVYPEDISYVGMRLGCALLGSLVPPLAYLTTWEISRNIAASSIAASLLIFDTGSLSLSQYILLDPPLILFITAATYSYVKFLTYKDNPFCNGWWLWLKMTGFFLGCSFSVKYVGVFVVLLIGLGTIQELWEIWGNLAISLKEFMKHFFSRAICLIAIPIALYLIFFTIHLEILYKSGDGDGFFSSAFQIRLEGNKLHNARMPEDVAYGSVVTIKAHRTGGYYLHSHVHLYPDEVGVRQQQVTCYSHKDQNNEWVVKKHDYQSSIKDKVEFVRNGDFIRLEHIPTTRNLHGHKEPAPMTKQQYQVSAYGINGTGDANDIWRVVIKNGVIGQKVKAVRSVIQLVHMNLGCPLTSHNKKLPKWGWEQQEVTCNPHKTFIKHTYWNIEEVTDQRLPFSNFADFALGFWSIFLESHTVMLQGNAGLKPKEGEDTSQPWQWPINYRGQVFSAGQYRVYLLGNPVIFWFNLAVLCLFCVLYMWHQASKKHGCLDVAHVEEYKDRMMKGAGFLFIGWVMHYLPFWTMGRVLYFHHYFPAFVYSCMITGITVEYGLSLIRLKCSKHFSWNVYHTLLGVLFSGIFYSFYLFHPLSYGMTGPNSRNETSMMAGLRWLDTWDV